MYAVIEESGGQRRITEGDKFLIDLYESGEAKPGAKITFDKVLVVGEEGGTAKLGAPYVKGASVIGHRQRYTAVKVTGIKG